MQHVVVIGAGIVGLLTAYELRRRGHRVELRSQGIAEGASFAAAGMLAPAAEIQHGQGPLWDIMRAAGELHRELAAELPGAGYRDASTLVVGRDAADLADLRALGAVQRATGAEVRELTGAALHREEGALLRGLAGGVLLERDHQVDPRRLAASVLDALGATGPSDPAPRSARSVPGAGPPVEIRRGAVTDCAGIEADAVVLAAGLGVPAIDGPHRALDLSLRPVHGDILRLRVPQSLLLPGEENLVGRTVRALVRGRPVYLVPRDDRTLVLGATSREDDLAGTSAGGVLQLLQDAAEILPAVRETELLEVTTRDRPGTPDDLPLLGPVPGAEHVIVSTGYHRHGILLAAWAAQRTADLIDAVPPDSRTAEHLHAVRPDRFTPGAAPTGAPVFEEAR
ncbi:glycine oxidase ThiO [Brachybacterium sp. AOP43-C2-M15]|uniref:glycine oxidase ThiO n=1 Tax=Brachybacterium sp. AOP43-C2-M15 TaxID=3457661 RepID=UPI004034799B